MTAETTGRKGLTYWQAEVRVHENLKIQAKLALSGDNEVMNVPLLMSGVGGGKTSMARAQAERFSLPLRAINNGENSDPTDVSGVPVPWSIRQLMSNGTVSEQEEAKNEYMKWVLNRYAEEACQEGVFLFLDDLDKAPPPIQGALLGIIGNRRFRDRAIHPSTLIMAAGNRTTDDIFAHQISESLKTRLTIIEMDPDVISFCDYGIRTGRIHEMVCGFLQYKPEFLHKWMDGVNRFPTPRGWREVTVHFNESPDAFSDPLKTGGNDNWKTIVAEKCGDPVSKDFWAWYKIIRRVDVDVVLRTGSIDASIKGDDGKPADKRMAEFATIFAVAQRLNTQGVKKEYVGLNNLFDNQNKNGISKEMRVALAVQLKREVRTQIAKLFTKAADQMMEVLVPTENNA
jgi:AAA domain (dynein-related subfamily)